MRKKHCTISEKYYLCNLKQRQFFDSPDADIAQLVEQLICNQPVVGSSPSIGSTAQEEKKTGEFQSGQMGQTVNLLAKPSEVRILPLPLFFLIAEVAHLVERQPSKL